MTRSLIQAPSPTSLRVPPHHLEAERSVLGAILVQNDVLYRVVEHGLEARDFYKDSHQKIFELILFLSEKGEPVDLVTLTTALKDRNWYETVGGSQALTTLFEDSFAVANVSYYAKIVREKALLRRMIETVNEIACRAFEGVEDIEEFLDEAEQKVFAVSDLKLMRTFSSMHDILMENMHIIEELAQKKETITGLALGFHDLDRMTCGLQAGQLLIIAGRPAMGKTSLVLTATQFVALQRKAVVAFFSLEMSKEELGFKLLSGLSRIESKKLKTGRLLDRDWQRLAQAADQLSKSKIFLDDSGDLSVLDMRARCRRLLSAEKKLDLVIVDYLQLMRGTRVGGSRGDNSREREISEISRSLKALSKELKVPIIALSQLNRGVESRQDKRPMLSDLRECVTGNTLVVLADGRRVPIRDLVGQTPEVLSMNAKGKIIRAQSDLVWCVGKKPIFEITLASGRKIQATCSHRLYSLQSWKKVSELKVGDRLAIARMILEPKATKRWSDDRVALLGELIGDGSYLVHGPMRYTTASEECSQLVTQAAINQFNVRVTRYKGRGNWHQLLFSGNGNRWHPAGMNLWLRKLGVYGQRSHQKRIPSEAFALDNKQIGLLLRHLWATDGTIYVRKTGQRGSHGVHFSTCSRGLADDVSALLLRLGIVARIQTVKSVYKNPVSMVWVRGVEAQSAFLSKVGAFGPRKVQAEKLATALSNTSANTNVDTVPVEIFDRVRSLMKSKKISWRSMATRRGTSFGGSSHFSFAPSRGVLKDYAMILNDKYLKDMCENDIFWDRIMSIVSVGEDEVYDLTVPSTASWLADGIVSHNSGAIEQDADMVCFVYRDEVYNKETEDKGVAELIVAKHRSGETGTVRLSWLPEYTLFGNLASDMAGTPMLVHYSDKGR